MGLSLEGKTSNRIAVQTYRCPLDDSLGSGLPIWLTRGLMPQSQALL